MTRQPELDIVMCCIPRDLSIARLAVDGIIANIGAKTISVITKANAFAKCRRVLGGDVELLDERDLSGEMSLEQFRARRDIKGFPRRAGWYFQQLVKLGYALRGDSEGYYLIWDCDTIPLRPLTFFSNDNRPLYTMSEEQHLPYFETFERLFGYRPEYSGSFISQHMIINKSIAREMLGELSARHPNDPTWSWAIMNNLAPLNSMSLFSEYETYGYYVESRYPETIAFRRLPWLREGSAYANSAIPSPQQLRELSEQYYFAAFEGWHLSKFSRIRRRAHNLIRGYAL